MFEDGDGSNAELSHGCEKVDSSEVSVGGISLYSFARGRTRTPALSASRAKDFKQCPLLYRFRVIDKLPEPVSVVQKIGTAVHYALENLYKLPPDERIIETAQLLVRKYWERTKNDFSDTSCSLDSSQKDNYFFDEFSTDIEQKTNRLLKNYFSMESPRIIDPQALEHCIEINVNNTPLRGIIDRIDISEFGEITINDYKTGKSPTIGFESEALFQMKFYAALLWHGGVGFPTNLRLMYLGDGTIIEYSPHQQEIMRFLGQLTVLWQKIEELTVSGEFKPRRSRLCNWCAYQKNCPEFGGTIPKYPKDKDFTENSLV